jgi:hypothetical protein
MGFSGGRYVGVRQRVAVSQVAWFCHCTHHAGRRCSYAGRGHSPWPRTSARQCNQQQASKPGDRVPSRFSCAS